MDGKCCCENGHSAQGLPLNESTTILIRTRSYAVINNGNYWVAFLIPVNAHHNWDHLTWLWLHCTMHRHLQPGPRHHVVSTAGPPLKEASINTTLSTYQHVTVVSLCVHTAISGQDQETLFRTGHLHYPQTGKAFTLDWTDHIGIVFPTY